ncbi:MAG: DUF5684 domain-containing protein, partial [Candidatus Saccharimonadales bacterium]
AVVAFIIIYLIAALIIGKVFKKAGRKQSLAFVPYYNLWVLFEISGKPGWWGLLVLIPLIGGVIYFILYTIAMLELAKRFNRSPVFAVFGLIIFSLIGFIMLGFGKSQYNGGDGFGGAAGARPGGLAPSPNQTEPAEAVVQSSNPAVVVSPGLSMAAALHAPSEQASGVPTNKPEPPSTAPASTPLIVDSPQTTSVPPVTPASPPNPANNELKPPESSQPHQPPNNLIQ